MKIVSKLTIFLLSLLMFLNTLSVNIIAENNEDVLGDSETQTSDVQIGDYQDYDNEGKPIEELIPHSPTPNPKSIENGDIKISKIISGTDKENEFKIDLDVETKNIAGVLKKEEDAAVVLVLDVSTSLFKLNKDKDLSGGFAYDYRKNIIKACEQFSNNFGPNENNKRRYLSIVTFYKNVQTVDWQDISDSTIRANMNSTYFTYPEDITKLNSIYNTDYVKGNHYGGSGTGTDGALKWANKLLDDDKVKDIENKYVILMTDGVPNAYIPTVSFNINSKTGLCYWAGDPDDENAMTKWNEESRLYNESLGGQWYNQTRYKVENNGKTPAKTTPANYKGDAGIFAADLASETAAELKNKCTIFAIGYGNDMSKLILDGSNSVDYDKVFASRTTDEKGGIYGTSGYGKSIPDGRTWLKFTIATDPDETYVDGDDKTIVLKFDEIYQAISKEVNAWTVSDPLGEDVELIKIDDECIVEDEDNKKNVVVNDGVINWDLKISPHNDSSPYKYKLSYTVKLNNLNDGFVFDNYQETNGLTFLDYAKYDSETEDPTKMTDYFYVPRVEGYEGSFSFKKTDLEGNLLQGAEFELSLIDEDKTWSVKEKSDADGIVTFKGIPSGHKYKLTETLAPTRYEKSTLIYYVDVDYGNVSIFDSEHQPKTIDDFSYINVPSKGNITVTKIWNDNDTGRPTTSVFVNLYKQVGTVETFLEKIEIKKPSTSSNVWTAKSSKSYDPYDEEGNRVYYFVKELDDEKEINVGDIYNEKYTEVFSADPLTVINAKGEDYITSISIKKEWNDSELGGVLPYTRPESVEVNVYGETDNTAKYLVDTITLKAENGWTYTFSNLPKYSSNKEQITYSVKEVPIDGFTSEVSTSDNTNFLIKNDVDFEEVLNPLSISIFKYDSMDAGKKPLKDAEFTVIDPNSNKTTYTTDSVGKVEIDSINLPGTYKVQETKAPELYVLDSTEYELQVVKEETPSISYDSENKKWVKTYDLCVSNTLTNFEDNILSVGNKPETNTLKITKIWDDADYIAADNTYYRPAITINIYSSIDGGETAELFKSISYEKETGDVLETNTREFEVEVPKYIDNVEAQYSIKENQLDAFDTKIENYTITNTPKKTKIDIEKSWNDGEEESTRPEEINVKLHKVIETTDTIYKEYVLNEDNNWKIEDVILFSYDPDGNQISYYAREMNGNSEIAPGEKYGDNYIASYSSDSFAITNTKLTSISPEVIWDDYGDIEHTRLTSVKVKLYENGEPTDKTVTITNNEGEWIGTFSNLPQYDSDGEVIEYTVKELDDSENPINNNGNLNDDYTVTYSGDGLTITNTYTTSTSVDVEKIWHDGSSEYRPASVTIDLFADNVKTEKTLTLTAGDEWKGSFIGLTKYKKTGTDYEAIKYSIAEETVDGYLSSVGDDYKVTNTKLTSISPEVIWDDYGDIEHTRLTSVKVKLYENGEPTDKTVTITNNEGEWIGTFSNLPQYDSDGEVIEYTVKELDDSENPINNNGNLNDDYTVTYSDDGLTITNHFDTYTSISSKIIWDDNDNQDGVRPESVYVQLVKISEDGEETVGYPIEQSDTIGLQHLFDNLPKYKDGTLINYNVREVDEDGNLIINQYDPLNRDYLVTFEINDDVVEITNHHTPEVIEKTVTKIWDDNDNQDGLRPKQIQIHLYKSVGGATPELILDRSINLNLDDGWSYTYKDLPKYENGNIITYSIKEAKVENYETSYSSDTFTITNKHIPFTIDVSYVVVWNDNDNQDGKRLDEVEVQLFRTIVGITEKVGNPIKTNEENNWEHTFEDLSEYENGKKITYTIKELVDKGSTPVEEDGDLNKDYTVNYSGDDEKVVITNTHIPETRDVEITVIWDDESDKYHKRPDEVTVELYGNDELVDSAIVTGDTDEWKHIFEDLPIYKDGKEIEYSVKEISKDGIVIYDGGKYDTNYKVHYSELTIINIYRHKKPVPDVPPKTGIN